MSAPHQRPDIGELVEAVREWIERDVAAVGDGRLRFHARVASNMLAMVERELAAGATDAAEHAARLASLGVDDDAALAAAIGSGELDDRLDEVLDVLRASTAAKLAVANPRYA